MPAELVQVTILLRRVFVADFQNWARSRGASPQMAGGQLLESELAEFRARKFHALTPRDLQEPTLEMERRIDRRRRVNPETVQKILHRASTATIAELSKECGLPRTTVARILRSHQEHVVHVPTNVGARGIRRRPSSESRSFTVKSFA